LSPGKVGIGKELIQASRDLGISAGADGLLEHARNEPISRLTARLCCAIDVREEVIRDCDGGLA